MAERSDHIFLDRTVTLAERAMGFTTPNPMVGCVIVRNGKIVGEGWHDGPGRPHAEPVALAAAGDLARGAIAYVSLEPCNHHGRTPPCSEALIAAGVREVVYAVADPNPIAAGGAERLRAAGVAVRQVEHRGAEYLVRPWARSLGGARPYVHAKLAMTLDGRTATRTGDSKWITGPEARARGHDLRQRCDAILVGIGTVLADDPGLDARPEGREPAPIRKVVLDRRARTPLRAKLFGTPGPVTIAVGEDADLRACADLRAAGAEILSVGQGPGGLSLEGVLGGLAREGVRSVLIEGGGTLLGTAFDAGLVDEVHAFVAPIVLGGGRSAIAGQGPLLLSGGYRLTDVQQESLGPDFLIRGLCEREDATCSRAS